MSPSSLMADSNNGEGPSIAALLLSPGAEFLFVLLPLLVLAIVFIAGGRPFHDVLASPEWAFGASVLFGQAIIKLVSGTSREGVERWEAIVLFISIAIVFGLVPSLTVLALILVNEHPGDVLIILQLALFLIGAVVFFILGAIGHYGLFHNR